MTTHDTTEPDVLTLVATREGLIHAQSVCGMQLVSEWLETLTEEQRTELQGYDAVVARCRNATLQQHGIQIDASMRELH